MKKIYLIMTLVCMMMSCRSDGSKGKVRAHEYVDLGLSVKWATCNVGATSPKKYGDYFAWGEINTKGIYTEDNCVTYGKQVNDILDTAQYDAARANWGGNWRMPTKAEMQELVDKCVWTWTTQNCFKGYKVTGLNGNSIFLSAAGNRNGASLDSAKDYGYYWTYTPDENYDNYAYGLGFGRGGYGVDYYDRNYGLSVRPVLE